MRLSKSFVPTLKEVPSDAVIPSHRLMLRAGLMRQLGSGIFSFLPLGYKIMKKTMNLIREEMDAIGGQEFHLPALNPIEIWEKTGRVEAFGDILFHIKNRPLVLAPTHEEIMGWIAANHIESYKDLPQIWYQIQTKFRNEPRPRSGVLRGRQFVMKDSYSLDTTWDGLDKSYDAHAEAYKNIFKRAGLKFFIVGASSGAMGGTGSQEFMVESPSGEDTCAICEKCGYAANIEVATSNVKNTPRLNENLSLKEIPTPGVKTIDELIDFLKVNESILAKSLVYMVDKTPYLILMMGNDQLNETKIQSILGPNARPVPQDELAELTGADAGSIGPIGLKGFKILADKRLENANGLISGSNKNDFHIGNIDLNRDVKIDGFYDMRTVGAGEPCPSCNEQLRVVNAIELGHIFKLGTKYADSLDATYLDENGVAKSIVMGSYGIGVERIIACSIEQNHDNFGIIWNKELAPYEVHLVLVNSNVDNVIETAEKIYTDLEKSGIDVLFDDRKNVSPGFKFKDADLIGIPIQVIVGEKNVVNNKVEIKERTNGNRQVIDISLITDFVKEFYS